MTDLSPTVIPKSDQLNADDLITGPRTITISKVAANPDAPDQPISVYFEGDNGKPYKPCKSMRRVLIAGWGPDGTTYPGKSLTLFNDPSVKFGGIAVGGIRISHMSGLNEPKALMLTTTRSKRSEYVVKPIADASPPAPAQPPDLLDDARAAADKGSEAFAAFWNSPEVKPHRDTLRPSLDDLKRRAKQSDEESAPDARTEGKDAREMGFDGPNPYSDGTDEARDWQAGYDGEDK